MMNASRMAQRPPLALAAINLVVISLLEQHGTAMKC
jgi:hypothetical protein